MKKLLIGVAAVALLAGCGGKDKAEEVVEGQIVEMVDAGATKVEKMGQKALPKVKLRDGDKATAGDALAALSLADAGEGRFEFGDSNLKGDDATITDLVLTAEDAEDGDVKIDKLELENLAMVDGKATFARMTMSDITLTPPSDEDGQGKIKSIELINPSPETAAWVASVMGQGEPADFPVGEGLSFDKWSMNDVDFSITDDDGQGTFEIDTIEINNLDGDKAGRVLVDSINLDMVADSDGPVKVNIDKMELRGIEMKMLTAMMENGGDEDAMAEAMMEILNRDTVEPGYDSVIIDDMSASVMGANFSVPKLKAYVTRDKNDRPTQIRTEPYKMSLTPGEGELGTQLAQGLSILGYETVEISGESLTNYDPDTDTMSYAKGKNHLTLKDGFRLHFAGKIAGMNSVTQAVAAQGEAAAPPDPEAMLRDLVIHNFELKLKDDSFVDRAFNAYAAQSGQDPDQMKNQMGMMMAMAPMMAAQAGVDAGLAQEVTGALSEFLTDPKTLTISMSPETPLTGADLAALADDPTKLTKEFLGLSASNK